MFASATSPKVSVVHVQVYFKCWGFFYLSFLPTRVAANSIKRNCASGWFVLPVGLYGEWKIIAAHPILTITLRNILRAFEAEILKIFKNIEPQPKNQTFLRKE